MHVKFCLETQGEGPLRKSRRSSEGDIKMDLRNRMRSCGLERIGPEQGSMAMNSEVP
jgi:hypothetical protein